MKQTETTIVLSAGGTGGHIFPAEALGAALKAQGYRLVLITDARFENYAGKLKQGEYYIIPAGSMSGGVPGKLKGFVNILRGYIKARSLLKKLEPKVVVGFGGYPSFATMLAASHKNIPTIIHEQNSLIGRANAALVSRVNCVATSFPEVKGLEASDKVKFTGNPVRPAIRQVRDTPYPSQQGEFRILVTGGSQGASVFARVVPQAISMLPEIVRQKIVICQQARPAEVDAVKQAYAKIGVVAEVVSFFTDIPAKLAKTHLVVARAGASTLAELTVAGRPALLIPYPFAKDNHQQVNAAALAEAGGAWVLAETDFTPEALHARLQHLLQNPAVLVETAAKAKALGRPEADEALVKLVAEVCRSCP